MGPVICGLVSMLVVEILLVSLAISCYSFVWH